jgi:hypothetical protein
MDILHDQNVWSYNYNKNRNSRIFILMKERKAMTVKAYMLRNEVSGPLLIFSAGRGSQSVIFLPWLVQVAQEL